MANEAGLLFAIEHQQHTQRYHQYRPDSDEESLAAGFQFRETLCQTNSNTDNGVAQMLGLDPHHQLHMVRSVHSTFMLVKQQQDRTADRQYRKYQSTPGGLQLA